MMTNKEKYLLMFLGGIIVVAIYWFMIYLPLQEKSRLMGKEIEALREEQTFLALEYANKEVYLSETLEAQNYVQRVNDSFPAGLVQEDIIYIMKTLEDTIDSLTIQTYSIGKEMVVVQNIDEESKTDENTNYEQVIQIPVSVNFETTYNDYKQMLSFIQTYPSKLSVGNMNANSDLVNSQVVSTFDIFFYALESPNREYEPTEHFGTFTPKNDSVFRPISSLGIHYSSGVRAGEIHEVDDLVIGITSINSAMDTVNMYRAGQENLTKITADNPDNEPIEIHVSQNNDSYYYRYRTRSRTYPEDYSIGKEFVPGQVIDVKVISSGRYDAQDTSGVNATLINDTDLPMIVRVEYEDEARPRFNVINQEGNVSIIQ